MHASTLVLALLLTPPAAAPAADEHHHGVDEVTGPALTFDESVGATADTPRVRGLDEAAQHKRELDQSIPRVTTGPQLQVMPGARVHPSEVTGFEIQITATQAWSLDGYGRKRIEAAKSETEVLEVEARAQALEQRLAAAHAWIQLHAAQLELELAMSELASMQELVATMVRAREANVVTRADVAHSQVLEAQTEARVNDLQGVVHDLGLVLARETGSDASRPLETRGDYPNIALPSEDELRRRFAELDSLPAVAKQRLLARSERARAAEAKAANATTLNAGFSVQREATSDVVLFGVLGANVSVGAGARANGQATAAARRAEAEGEAIALELQATLTTAMHELHHTQGQLEILGEHSLPAHAALVASHEQALAMGEGTQAELLRARAEHSAISREYVAAQAEWVWARVEVWLYYEAFVAEQGSDGGSR
ncbi:Heavy metal RND efflux outer membrane protein, CzcC family protein [Enhygromyxa salina]|uniref:Heavy metal RND efflux outer membrane protein, CzcC family protein n=1 Tax=Enhygromyxa salina TaxID=215803 RepID=A0A0C2D856_9BACT|nr:TolC family protein [Enhygromyxa salina]KIG19311.1 Heavy metal RND efflux outer membrane protein, CzcC family protein [Enhygromyxa salina]